MKIRVGIIRDDRYLEHKTGHIHPEHPNRLRAVYRMLDNDFPYGLIEVEPELATLEYLEMVHTPQYIDRVLKTSDQELTSLAPDTPVCARSYLAAWLAAGGCLKGLDALLAGRCDACFCLVRPPGHHAMPDRAAGFCIFNNLGIAARYALSRYGFRRILIVDWDVHHGNGLSDLFYEERDVFYLSTHDPGLYPYSGDFKDTGKGEGAGYTVNLPVARVLTDGEMLLLYNEVLGPVFEGYRPELVLIAAGFDAHKDDPVGRSKLSTAFFGSLMGLILQMREGANHPPILLSLEGGYDPVALAASVKSVLNALSGTSSDEPVRAEKTGRVEAFIHKISRIHSRFGVWTGRNP